MVAREVLEVLVEEGGVGEGDDGTVFRSHLRALVAQAFHLAADAVTFDGVAHAYAAAHQLDAIEEVVEHVLQGEADTRGQTGGDNRQGRCGNLQQHKGSNHIDAPAHQRDDIVGQVEVDVGFLEQFRLVQFPDTGAGTPHLVKGLDGIDKVTEQEEETQDQQELEKGQVHHAFDVKEGLEEKVFCYATDFEDFAGKHHGEGERPDAHERQQQHF